MLDADNTLFDFDQAQCLAFYKTFADYGMHCDDGIFRTYEEINQKYWNQLEFGEVTKRELVVRRFAELFACLNVKCDAAKFNFDYLTNLGQNACLMPGALETCRELSQSCTLLIATNGVSRVQQSRVSLSPLMPYISHVVVSEDAGAEKPDEIFFQFALERCGNPDKRTVLMVGDSLYADMKGGHNAGLDTCWYNPKEAPLKPGVKPDYTIKNLTDLIEIVIKMVTNF